MKIILLFIMVSKTSSQKSNFVIIARLALILVALIGIAGLKFRADSSQDSSSLVNLESKIEAFLMNNPKVVVSALEKHYRQEKQIQQEQRQKNISSKQNELHNNSPFIGNPNASTVLVEFFDYNCGYCKKALETIDQLTKNNQDVKIVFKDFPILGPASLKLGQASVAAFLLDSDKYFAAHKALMALGRAANNDSIIAALVKIGYNGPELQQKMSSKEVNNILASNRNLARELGINGTPAFILNDRFIEGFVDYQGLSQMIKEVN